MDKFVIEGGKRLSGRVSVSRAKNAALPIMAAARLAEGKSDIKRGPWLADVAAMEQPLKALGARVERVGEDVEIEVTDEHESLGAYDLLRKMRAGFCVLGPLLARRGEAKVSVPGGCVIGIRPIDLHVKGFKALGAKVETRGGYVCAVANKLVGSRVFLGGPFGSTVLGTANVMMAAPLAECKTIIENAACEPEVENLAEVLIQMGAHIRGAGGPKIAIEGVKRRKGTTAELIPDRIEAGTWLAAAVAAGGHVTVTDMVPEHLSAVTDKLTEMGAEVEMKKDSCTVFATGKPRATTVVTHPYPGFPTDLQAQFMAILTVADGTSVVTEKVYPDRFMHISELQRMAADVRKEGPNAIVVGVDELSGAPVMASDLRASAALVIAGLAAEGHTHVKRVYHIDRGYEGIVEKLRGLGARIERVPDDETIAPEI